MVTNNIIISIMFLFYDFTVVSTLKKAQKKIDNAEKWQKYNNFIPSPSTLLTCSLTSHKGTMEKQIFSIIIILLHPSTYIMCFVVASSRYYVYDLMMLMEELCCVQTNISSGYNENKCRMSSFATCRISIKIDYKGEI